MKAASPFPVLTRKAIPYHPQMDGNDVLSNCTAVGLANALRAQSALAGFDVEVTQQQVIDFYSQSTGYSPGDPRTDQGGVETDVLLYQLQHGLQGSAPSKWYGLWGTIDPSDLNGIRNATSHLGCAYLGVNLAMADQSGGIWDTNTPGDQTSGSWGSHCLVLWSYDGTADNDLCYLATWGILQPATWRWIKSRIEEAHGIAYRQLIGPSGANFAGLDWARLEADVMSFAGATK